ncbi:hypothetical protein PROAA_610068 [Candidatus Propionivibrio aalborgensis]|uniref:Uncharacterized protein n=1 Tax=Candidatus Propionivibrio aalborgensis TaxID=1860101 RepID=A0A1A8Y2T3_9RHOO|nr:hypothetical protein PROAA_610068 [Candidatus Propionivibrio aalborgensis]
MDIVIVVTQSNNVKLFVYLRKKT